MTLSEKKMTFERLDDHRRRALVVNLNPETASFVVLCDAHKWDRGETDFFKKVEEIYLGSLDYYNSKNFTLILLGDIEEGAGDTLENVLEHYPSTFSKEKMFLPDRYLRVYGNHDHDWKIDDVRQRLLNKVMDAPIQVYPALLLGEKILVVHGHEGDLFSDELHGFSQVALRLFKRIAESLLGKSPRAAENSRIRSKRAQLLYEWGKQNDMMVIAGHTHLAYFESTSITRFMNRQIRKLEEESKMPGKGISPREFQERIGNAHKIRETHDRFWQLDESLEDNARPLYFNAGCCKYEDSLTAIEIADGGMALVKWGKGIGGQFDRSILASRKLNEAMANISNIN